MASLKITSSNFLKAAVKVKMELKMFEKASQDFIALSELEDYSLEERDYQNGCVVFQILKDK